METQIMEEGSPVAERPTEDIVRRPVKRSKALLVILGGGLVVAIVAAGAWLHYRDRVSTDDAQVDGAHLPHLRQSLRQRAGRAGVGQPGREGRRRAGAHRSARSAS